MDLELRDRVVLVTGGARGIGAATVRTFSAEGARVVIADRDGDAAETLASQTPNAHPLIGDLSDEGTCRRIIDTIRTQFGPLAILVNNAGVNDSVGLEASPADFVASLQRNLLPAYMLTHFARESLIATRGAVVNVSSKVAVTGQGRTSGYAAAKGALQALTREWALALREHGVRVNCVVPAECDSDQYRRWFASQPDPELARARVAALVPFEGRLTRPEEIADAIVWLASARASHLTGEFLFVDGGYTHLDRAATSAHHW